MKSMARCPHRFCSLVWEGVNKKKQPRFHQKVHQLKAAHVGCQVKCQAAGAPDVPGEAASQEGGEDTFYRE